MSLAILALDPLSLVTDGLTSVVTTGGGTGFLPPPGWLPDVRLTFKRPVAMPWPVWPVVTTPNDEPIVVGTDYLSPDDGTGVVYAYDDTTDISAFGLAPSRTTVTASLLLPGSLSPTPMPSLVSQVVVVGPLVYVVLGDVSALAEGSVVTLEWRIGVASVPATTVVARAELIVSASSETHG